MTDLSNYSLAQLRELQSQVAEQIEVRQGENVAAVRQQIVALAESVGMTVDQIMSAKGTREKKLKKTIAARYRHPEDTSKQWTGRGRKPRWIQEYLDASGKDIDSLLIK
jgi:DNA-binding protein H-NS